MSDKDEKKPARYSYRKRHSGRATVTVRTAFHSMGFDAVVEWIKAYRELENPESKIKALEKAFEYIFPKITAVDNETANVLDLEETAKETTAIEEQPTEKLLESLENKK